MITYLGILVIIVIFSWYFLKIKHQSPTWSQIVVLKVLGYLESILEVAQKWHEITTSVTIK